MGDLRDAFDSSVEANGLVQPVDQALVQAGRVIAGQIDSAVEFGEGQEVTKALYLTPHLVNILKEMLATPAARKVANIGGKEDKGGNLGRLKAVPKPSKSA